MDLTICFIRIFNSRILRYISNCEVMDASKHVENLETDVNIKVEKLKGEGE